MSTYLVPCLEFIDAQILALQTIILKTSLKEDAHLLCILMFLRLLTRSLRMFLFPKVKRSLRK